jgi:1-pyrroline-5-carboxylate dehydrogenase
MTHSVAHLPAVHNERIRTYAPGSPEKASLKKRLDEMLSEEVEIPAIIGGREVRTGDVVEATCPHDHSHVLARVHQVGNEQVEDARKAAAEAWKEWSDAPWESRAAVLWKAAELLAGPWRDTLNAATMLGQSKTVYQAEIDSACELIDFWRFNTVFMRDIYAEQPRSPQHTTWNRVEYRALEGFVFAVTPFNFTAIAGNLPTAPALMGNTVLWKPATTAIVSAYYVQKILEQAGMPPGVINFLPGRGSTVGNPVLAMRELAGIHFTGSTPTFQHLWRTVGENIADYATYPRLVGETGGKDFVFAHPSADVPSLVTALVRGAFEYQGQKCSAASRAYVSRSLWPEVKDRLVAEVESIEQGPVTDFRNFMAAVIDEAAFEEITGYIARAERSGEAEILVGGGSDRSDGWFIEPTVIEASNPRYETMREEIFGPVLTVWVYDDHQLDEALTQCDETSPYGLTGAIFARDRRDIDRLSKALRHTAGNFYINDKPTGAVVSRQPFGGSRASGTNDKAGSFLNLLRWTSQRAIKETFVPATDYRYAHMDEK